MTAKEWAQRMKVETDQAVAASDRLNQCRIDGRIGLGVEGAVRLDLRDGKVVVDICGDPFDEEQAIILRDKLIELFPLASRKEFL